MHSRLIFEYSHFYVSVYTCDNPLILARFSVTGVTKIWLVNFFYFKKFRFFRIVGFFVVGTTGQVCLGVCISEFWAYSQTFSALFFTHILECINILLWVFFVFCYCLFCTINCKMSVAVFLLVSFLHFISCVHMHIV